MQKASLFCAFFCIHAPCSEPINTLAEGIDIAKLGVVVIKTGKAAFSAAFPDTETQAREEAERHTISVLRRQEDLTQCLITHARDTKDEDQFPCACSQSAEKFAELAGFLALSQVQAEFREAIEEIPAESDNGISFKETLKIAAIVTAGCVVFIMIPVISPVVASAAETVNTLARDAVVAQIAANPIKETTFILQALEGFDIFDSHQTTRELQHLQESIAKKGTLRERIHKAHLK